MLFCQTFKVFFENMPNNQLSLLDNMKKKSTCHTCIKNSFFYLFYRYNPVREAEEMPSTDDIWKLLHSKIMNSFSSVKQAFLVFDDVSEN